MILTPSMYVPALRWRMAEYQALARLSKDAKSRSVPLITIPDIEYDFEEERPKKTVHEHVFPFPTRFMKKWGSRPAWIAIHEAIADQNMNNGRSVWEFLTDELDGDEAMIVPVVADSSTSASLDAVGEMSDRHGLGVGISVRLEDLMLPAPADRIELLMLRLNVSSAQVDLIIDLGAPSYEPYSVFAKALMAAIRRIGDLHRFRNFVLLGTAMPSTFKKIARGGDTIPRHDWLFYRALSELRTADFRLPNYGDYTVVHPEFVPGDMRKIKPAGKIVYTTPEAWLVHKGSSFRDNPAQMHDHCAAIVASSFFRGDAFSAGDQYLARCAAKVDGPSNQTRWKNVAINHHISHVLDDLATLFSGS